VRVFLSQGGWVKMFDDGQVAGPVSSKAEADAIISIDQKINKVVDGNFSRPQKSAIGRSGSTGCRKSNY
jgi:hypothetical protein